MPPLQLNPRDPLSPEDPQPRAQRASWPGEPEFGPGPHGLQPSRQPLSLGEMRCKGSWLTVAGSGGEAPATSRVTWAGRQQWHAQRQGRRQLQRIPTGGVLLGRNPTCFSKQYPIGTLYM